MAIEMDTERRASMVAMSERGVTQTEIARQFGISQPRVSKILHAARREEAARRADLDRAMLARRQADDTGELLLVLSRQPRIGKTRELLRRTLGNWHGYALLAHAHDHAYAPKPEVKACVDALKREMGLA